MKHTIPVLLMSMVLFVGRVSQAQTEHLLMLLPGFPGTTEQAQPYVDQMLRHLESELGWPKGSMTGRFISDGAGAESQLARVKPGIALVEPSVYAMHHKRHGMKIIARVHANGRGEQAYYVVTRADGPANLSELANKTLSGVLTHDPKYVQNVLLDNKAPATIRLVTEARPLQSLRNLNRNKVDAALIDQDTRDHMSILPFASELQIIHTSTPVPAPVIVVLNNGKKHAPAIRKALVGMCDRPSGKELCRSLTLTSITTAGDSDYQPLLKRYNR